ncbi:uncharacterized protein LOC129974949 isoform X1 [Argiope bruennichi]|uniref:uncharacterized protein LOC129974949 isoform X1 n=1 Tax=Argiope bruennichi TaxID=94029 RepID=UPI0024951E15|nr:uncharacterized protein LOC129974949 isoform X1 [Argiope bruennichi]
MDKKVEKSDDQEAVSEKKLNKLKGSIKTTLKRIESFNAEKSASKDINAMELEVKLRKLGQLQAQLDKISEQYCGIETSEDIETILEDIDQINIRIEETEVGLKLLLNSIKDEFKINPVSKDNAVTKIRLPEIPLPEFSGKIADFANFKNLFVNLISNNEQLNDSQKLYYLRACLRGEAKLLESSSDNFQSLFKALSDRYENQRQLIDSHILEIINFEKIRSESAKEPCALIDCVNKNIRALKVLTFEQNKLSDLMLVNIILQKVDKETRKQFELSLNTAEIPAFENLMKFLEKRSSLLENINRIPSKYESPQNTSIFKRAKTLIVNNKNSNAKACILCKNYHALFRCVTFQNMSIDDRKNFVRNNKLCINCLKPHPGICKSKYSCNIPSCGKRHNSLIHDESAENRATTSDPRARASESQTDAETKPKLNVLTEVSALTLNARETKQAIEGNKSVILNTLLIYVKTADGRRVQLRGLLDNASTLCILREDVARKLGIKLKSIKQGITGINGITQFIKHAANIEVSNRDYSFSHMVKCSILPKITDEIPVSKLNISALNIPCSIELADFNFHTPGQIDILLGSELFFEILKPEQLRLQNGDVILQNTKFGYLVTGILPQLPQKANCYLVSEPNLDEAVKQFFELESLPDNVKEITKSEEEIYCEEHFVKTYKRDKTGRFIVQLPIKENAESLLGNSKENAIKRLNGIWNKLNKNNTMEILYKEFMQEYESLEHMEEIKIEDDSNVNYYIPHHAIYKPEKTSTPLRVVFDASAKTTSGYSLNSILLNGGIIQQDLFSIVSRFRKHRYAFSADIKKMYRQILIDPTQRDLQRIVWKSSADGPVKIYKLSTVTYGTVSAPFLATRTLRALADEEKKDFPKAADVICSDFYMDDILSGDATLEDTKNLQTQISELLGRAGFELHKWVANNSNLLQNLSTTSYSFSKEQGVSSVKTLGMFWDPKEDCFTYKVKIKPKDSFSKREVLSEIASLYDPLGLLGPLITKAKIFIQGLWKIKLDWNEKLPSDAMTEWKRFYIKLSEVNNFRIQRFILLPDAIRIEIHGFSDASERAYAAVVYLKCFTQSGQFKTSLVCSKSRVAPLKSLTIPRLELCAALLLSRLVKKIVPILQLPIDVISLWTDSTIVLAWIKTEPYKLKTFVSNRVAEIQTLTSDCHWKHKLHLNTFRQIRRLESTGRSPICSLFMEAIQGVSSISAYGVKKDFIQTFEEKLDRCLVCTFNTYVCNRWLAFCLNTLGSSIVFITTILAIQNREALTPAVVGLIITYSLTVTDSLKWFVRTNSELENKSISIERIEEYCNLEPEAPWDLSHEKLANAWPQNGIICFEDYSTKYRKNLDLVLKEINFSIEASEKVGIIGRTGAGKSSITLALFRIIEPVSGTILIDDVDITKIGLHNLRTKLTIIPQDQVLFTGTLRINLDPNNEHSDDQLWDSLEKSYLKTFVSNLNEGLEYEIEEGGSNLSAGQRQLVCLARALLKNSKILVLDEATASVDMDTDNLIQNTIRTAFADRTVITIAHRINTVLDYDKIVVLENGNIIEVGNPSNLLENQNSRFYLMSKEAGLI